MRRIVPLALAAVMTLLLCVGAFAASAVVSPQKLEIDGWEASAQPYNIEGNNYFKLRDVACLLAGTTARFGVTYEAKTGSVYLTTGERYARIGGELAPVSGGDREAVESAQTIYVDGRLAEGIQAYNIDGSNYLRLRDLGEALHFGVDYDEARNTIVVTTGQWAPGVVFRTTDTRGKAWTETCFANHRLTIVNRWAYTAPACAGEMQALEQLAQEYAGRGVQVVGLYDAETEEQSIAKIHELGVTYPCLRYTSDFDAYLDTGFIPVSLLIDCYGRVVGRIDGSMSYEYWAAELGKYLGES